MNYNIFSPPNENDLAACDLHDAYRGDLYDPRFTDGEKSARIYSGDFVELHTQLREIRALPEVA